jgi:hypothetical protein
MDSCILTLMTPDSLLIVELATLLIIKTGRHATYFRCHSHKTEKPANQPAGFSINL